MERSEHWREYYKAGLEALAEHRLDDAEQWFASAVRQLETAEEPEHLADVLRQLAHVRRNLGRVGEALEDSYQLLEVQERISGKCSREVAKVMRDLAELYKDMGRYTEAASILETSNQTLDTLMDMCIADVADAFDILADVYRVQGRIEDARWHEKQAMIHRKAAWGSDGRSSIESLGCYLEAMVEMVKEMPGKALQGRTETQRKRSRKAHSKDGQ